MPVEPSLSSALALFLKDEKKRAGVVAFSSSEKQHKYLEQIASICFFIGGGVPIHERLLRAEQQ
jgi:hypothetical protein